MKRMTENPMSYFEVTPEDTQNITLVDSDNQIYTYTPSEKFLEVVKSLKSPLIFDWRKVSEPVTLLGSLISVLYPMQLTNKTENELGYMYRSCIGDNTFKIVFYHLNDGYYFQFII